MVLGLVLQGCTFAARAMHPETVPPQPKSYPAVSPKPFLQKHSKKGKTTRQKVTFCFVFFVFCRGFWWYGFGVRLGTVLDGSWRVCGGDLHSGHSFVALGSL